MATRQSGLSIAPDNCSQHPWRSTYKSETVLLLVRRTVQATLQDCRFTFDLDSRNAMWGAALHLTAGIAPFQKPPFKKPPLVGPSAAAADGAPEGSDRAPDGPSGAHSYMCTEVVWRLTRGFRKSSADQAHRCSAMCDARAYDHSRRQ